MPSVSGQEKNNEHFIMKDIHQSKNSKSWYAIYVKSRHEKCVYNELKRKNIESSFPLTSVIRLWSDRKKKVYVPLFRGYVFIKIDIQNEKLDVLQVDGVVKFVTFGSKPAAIPEVQMYWLDRLITTSNVKYEQEFPVGRDVKVTYGPFKGLIGKVKQKKSETRLVVWFDAIMQGVSVDIPSIYMSPILGKNINPVKTGNI